MEEITRTEGKTGSRSVVIREFRGLGQQMEICWNTSVTYVKKKKKSHITDHSVIRK